MVVVFNGTAFVVLASAIAAWVGAQVAGFDAWRLVAGFAVMAIVGGAIELQPRAGLRPRFFWIVPAWFAGLVGLGLALLEPSVLAGAIVLAACGLGIVALIVRAALIKPGGRWVVGLAASSSVAIAFQLVGYYRPEWKQPALYAVNVIALVAMIYCGYQLHLARKAKVKLS